MNVTTTHPSRVSHRRVGIAVSALAAGMLLALGGAVPAHASVVQTVQLGTADSYEVLAGSTITNTGNTVINNGDVGLYPGTSITGYPPAVINNGVIHDNDAEAQQAQADLTTAYLDASGRAPDAPIVGDLAGQTFQPGVYNGGAVENTGAVTLNGGALSVFIFQAASTLVTGSGSTVNFTNTTGDPGLAGPCNVFWQVGTSATLGAGSLLAGTVLALSSISVNAGATVDGRLLTQNQAATGITVTLNRPADCATRSPIVASTPTAAQAAAAQAAAAAAAAAAARAAAAAPRLPATGVNPMPGLATAAALFLVGGILVVKSRSRRHPVGISTGRVVQRRRR